MRTLRINAIVILLLCFVANVKSETIFNVKSLKLAAGYPAEFLLDLEQGDNLTVTYKQVGGNGDFNKLKVYVVDLNQIEETIVKEFKNRSDYIRVPTTGLYKLVFEYKAKNKFSWRRSKYVMLSVKAESLQLQELGAGESRQMIRIGNLALDDEKQNSFKLAINLNSGDKLYISSGDQKASFVKMNVIQLGINKFISSVSTLDITRDGVYSFEFYLEENKEATGIYQTLASLLSNSDVNFTDLVITRERAVKGSVSYNNNSGNIYGDSSSSDADAASATNVAEDDPNARFQAILEQMQSSSDGSSETSAAIVQLMQEQQKMYAEMLNKKEVVEVTPMPRSVIKLSLDPKSNFSKNVGMVKANRVCELLNLKGAGTYNLWFYWLGVGEKAEEAFEIEKDKYANYNQKNLIQQKVEYLYFSNNDQPELAGINPPLPRQTDQKYQSYFSEDVEYAVVDYVNSQRFLKGENFVKMNSSSFKYVSTDEGIAFKPPTPKEEYFICMANNNKNTKIDVFFAYFLIGVNSKSY